MDPFESERGVYRKRKQVAAKGIETCRGRAKVRLRHRYTLNDISRTLSHASCQCRTPQPGETEEILMG